MEKWKVDRLNPKVEQSNETSGYSFDVGHKSKRLEHKMRKMGHIKKYYKQIKNKQAHKIIKSLAGGHSDETGDDSEDVVNKKKFDDFKKKKKKKYLVEFKKKRGHPDISKLSRSKRSGKRDKANGKMEADSDYSLKPTEMIRGISKHKKIGDFNEYDKKKLLLYHWIKNRHKVPMAIAERFCMIQNLQNYIIE